MGDVANYDATNEFVFDAKLMDDGYLPSIQRANYFFNPHRRDVSQPSLSDIPTLYERYAPIEFAPFSDFFTMYKPIEQTTNLAIPYICIFKGTDSFFDVVKDLSILRAYYTNNFLSTTAVTTYNQLDSLISLLKPLLEGNSRSCKFISHSLGSTLANYCAYKLLSTSSLIRTQGLTQVMYNPYLLIDDAYVWHRDVDINIYNVKTHVVLNVIADDWVVGLVSTYGIGTVNKFSIVLSPLVPDTPISIHDDGYLTWLSEVLDYPEATSSSAIRALSYHIDWHKMANFNTDATALQHVESNYRIITTMANYSTLGLTIQAQKVYDLQHFLSTQNTAFDVRLMLTASASSFDTDYPHVVGGALQDMDEYRFTASINPGQESNYKKSINDTIVNFPLILRPKSDPTSSISVNLIRNAGYWDVISPDETIQYGIKNRGDITDLDNAPTITSNSVSTVSNFSATIQERYRFNVIEGWVHSGPRRDLHIEPIVYTGLRALFGDPASGEQLTYIKHRNTTNQQRWLTAIDGYDYNTKWFMTDGTYEGSANVEWTDGQSNPDESVWKIISNADGSYTIQNTEKPNAYVGRNGATYNLSHQSPELLVTVTSTISLLGGDIDATIDMKIPGYSNQSMYMGVTGDWGTVAWHPLQQSAMYDANNPAHKTIQFEFINPAVINTDGSSGIIITGN